MTNRLSTFIIALGENLALRRAYAENPEAVMAEHGLSASDAEALRSGDEATICRAIGVARDATSAKIVVAPTKGEADPAGGAAPDLTFAKIVIAPTKGEADAGVDAPADATFAKIVVAPTKRSKEAA